MADTIDKMYKDYNGFNYTTIVMFIASEYNEISKASHFKTNFRNTTDVDLGGVELSHFLSPGMKVAVISYGNESYTTFPKSECKFCFKLMKTNFFPDITTIYNWTSYPSQDLGQLIQGEICGDIIRKCHRF